MARLERRARIAGSLAVCLAIVGIVACSLDAQTTGPQVAAFHSTVDDSQQPYALYVPKSFTPGRKYPLVITLHQEDSNHRVNLRRIFGAMNRAGEPDSDSMRNFPPVRDVDFLIAAPYARGTMGYQGIAEKDVYDVLADVEQRFPVDQDRVYLTGISMGGGGALRLALTRPDVWAAVALVCASPAPGLEELAGNALNLPIRLMHGELDPLVPVDSSRAWHRRLLNLGVAVDYLEYAGVRHNAWDPAYKNGAIFDWFAQFRRNRSPDRVRLVTRSFRYGSAYWMRIDGLTPGVPASVDAVWKGKTALDVTTQNVDAFTVTLPQASTAPVVVTIDEVPLRVKPASSLSFVQTAGRWRQGSYTPAAKRAGLEGPVAEAVSGRHIYVYGSGGARTADDLEARRKEAETAAAWSSVRQKVPFTPAVKADTAVTADDLDSSDLVLFGTAQTNSVIARFAARLPIALSPAAADYGLLFIAPLDKHYALISSGLPWWTGADDADRGGYALAPPQLRLLESFGDYILFKGSLANVVAEGRFDRSWKLPAEAAARLAHSGTVTVR